MGKECCLRLSRRLWGGMKNELPKKRLRGRLDLNAHKSIGSNMRALVLLTFKIGDVNKRQSLKIYTLKCEKNLVEIMFLSLSNIINESLKIILNKGVL